MRVAFFALFSVTGGGFWLCSAYSITAYWLLYNTICDVACVASSLGVTLAHTLFFARLPHFVMCLYIGLTPREEEAVDVLLPDSTSNGLRVTLTRLSADGKLLPATEGCASASEIS